jgi:hypothetical protein
VRKLPNYLNFLFVTDNRSQKNNYLFDKKKGKLFFTVFFLAREQKNSGKKFFLFIEHGVLFYETPFLHRI